MPVRVSDGSIQIIEGIVDVMELPDPLGRGRRWPGRFRRRGLQTRGGCEGRRSLAGCGDRGHAPHGEVGAVLDPPVPVDEAHRQASGTEVAQSCTRTSTGWSSTTSAADSRLPVSYQGVPATTG